MTMKLQKAAYGYKVVEDGELLASIKRKSGKYMVVLWIPEYYCESENFDTLQEATSWIEYKFES